VAGQVERKNGQELKKKKKVQWAASKTMNCDQPHLAPNEKTQPILDRMANWCIGGCWFPLAPELPHGPCRM
jgi:hypothetical protein